MFGEAAKGLPREERSTAAQFEHIWPQAYGGDTIPENLALACFSCNQAKEDYANWAMVDIQPMAFGFGAGEGSLRHVSGRRRFALTSREALAVAERDSLTLKEAFRALQRRVRRHPAIRRQSEMVDFVNLTLHEDE